MGSGEVLLFQLLLHSTLRVVTSARMSTSLRQQVQKMQEELRTDVTFLLHEHFSGEEAVRLSNVRVQGFKSGAQRKRAKGIGRQPTVFR